MFRGLVFRVDDLGFKVDVLSSDLGFRVFTQGLELIFQGLDLKVQGLEFRVQGLELMFHGLGFTVDVLSLDQLTLCVFFVKVNQNVINVFELSSKIMVKVVSVNMKSGTMKIVFLAISLYNNDKKITYYYSILVTWIISYWCQKNCILIFSFKCR